MNNKKIKDYKFVEQSIGALSYIVFTLLLIWLAKLLIVGIIK